MSTADPHQARITVVGLGPGDQNLLTTQTARILDEAHAKGRLVLRTRRHPAAEVVPDAPSFDDVYERADSFEEVYQTCLLYTSPSPRDRQKSRMPSSA